MPAELLERYSVDPVRGFLPAGSPSMRLPPQFEPWERLAEDVPTLSMAGRFRLRARELPVRDFTSLTDPLELERAMLLLSVLGHAYVWGGERPARELPRSIAMPWWGLAEALGRKPIASHASMVLHNWRMLDADAGMKLDNLGALLQIVGGQDEQWFYLVPVAIEAEGAAALPAILRAQEASAEGAVESLVPELDFIAARLAKITAILQRTPEHCDPYIFYHRVRPFLTGWPEPGLIYEGVSREPKRFAGGSAAQSSLLQSIDAGLGVSHEDEESAPFLIEMRGYMPPKHRQFIELLERGPSVRELVRGEKRSHPRLAEAYDACIRELDGFRKAHLEIAVQYISRQASEPDKARGTGGTPFMRFLTTTLRETKAKLLGG